MDRIRFRLMDKAQKEIWLPTLFALLYENMAAIAPWEMGYEQERQRWLENVSPALEKAPRQILLCFSGDTLAGYVQYYVRERMLMVEEVQLRKAFHRTFLFWRLCAHLAQVLPQGIESVEAFADKRNQYSRGLMEKLGMARLEETGPFVHLRGDAADMRKIFVGRKQQ